MFRTGVLVSSVLLVILGCFSVFGTYLPPPPGGGPGPLLTPEEAAGAMDQLLAAAGSMEVTDGKPPSRPKLFQTPDQIRLYLDSLGKYYNYQNRNRFGKRSSPFSRSFIFPHSSSPLFPSSLRNGGRLPPDEEDGNVQDEVIMLDSRGSRNAKKN